MATLLSEPRTAIAGVDAQTEPPLAVDGVISKISLPSN